MSNFDRNERVEAADFNVVALSYFAFAGSCFFSLLGLWSATTLDAAGLVENFANQFNLDNEDSLTTWFATALLFANGAILFVVAAIKYRDGIRQFLPWFFLSLILLAMSVDEMLSLHERLTVPVRTALGTDGFLHFAWVIPGFIAAILVAILYLPLLRSLPGRIAALILASGFIYVAGAVGVELVGSKIASEQGSALHFRLASWVEESFEMLGQSLFAYALLSHIQSLVQIRPYPA